MIQVYTPGSMPGGFSAPGNSAPIETFGQEQLEEDHGTTALAVSYAPVSGGDVYVVDSTAGKIDIFTPPKVTAYAESFSFGSKGTGSGQFTEPLGIAVNDSTNSVTDPQGEDVYVVDKGNKRVEQFSKAGAFIRDFASPPGGFNEPEAIAVDNCKNGLGEPCSTVEDPSVGDVYVTDHLPPVIDEYRNGSQYPFSYPVTAVDKFSSTGTYLGQLRRCPEEELANGEECELVGHPTAGFDEGLTGVAVGPEGKVWVGTNDNSESLIEFSDEGAFEKYWGTGGFEVEAGLAVGADENGEEIGYIAGGSTSTPNIVEVVKFDFSTGAESDPFDGGGTSALALDPSTGELFVDKESSIERYGPVKEPKPSPLESFPGAGGLQESRGIAVSPAGTVYATERTANDVKAFKEFPLPQVAVGAVANLSATSVTLEGSVNPEGANVSSCEFEYGTTTAYGQIAECEPPAGSLGEGTEPKLVSARLSGLPSGTTYHYRLVASDAIGTNRGSDHLFTTPGPSVTAEQVTYVEATNATLNAQIDPDGGATSYRFEYDTSPYGEGEAPHGTRLPEPSVAIGAGTSPVSVSVKLTGLQAGKTYYYRAVAEGEPLGAPESFYGPNETFATNQAPGSAPPQNCPNEKLRAEQPYGLGLPDCRAYEIVSPLNSEGQDATDSFVEAAPRASVCGKECEERGDPAIIYTSQGNFTNPAGDTIENQFVSRRNAEKGRWETQPVEPPHEPDESQPNGSSFVANDLTPELTEGVAATTAKLTLEAPAGNDKEATGAAKDLYVDDFANGSYRYVGDGSENPLGSSTDLTHVVFGETGAVSEWVNGHVVPVGVTNEGEEMNASVGGMAPNVSYFGNRSVWRAVSADGSRVYFSTPATEEGPGQVPEPPGQLYVRVHAEQLQSPIASPEAAGTGTLTAGSDTVTALQTAAGTDVFGESTELTVTAITGRFVVGDPVSGVKGIQSGTTIAAVREEVVDGGGGSQVTLTLSAPLTKTLHRGEEQISSSGPAPFVVGEQVRGDGIPPGTTITAVAPTVAPGSLTLSAPAASSGSGVELRAGGGCTEPPGEEACTIDVSASQRLAANPAGIKPARYWGASTGAEGGEGGPGPERVFFTSDAELTEDAYTGAGNAANLYEYELVEEEAGPRSRQSAN